MWNSAEVALLDAAARANAALTTILEADSPQVVDLKNRVGRAFVEMQRLKAAEDQRAALFNARGRLVTNIETFVRDLDGELVALPEPAVKLGKNQNVIVEIEACRRRLRELGSDLRSVRTAPITIDAARAKMRATIEELAERGEPNVERLLFGGALELPMEFMSVTPIVNPDRLLVGWQQVNSTALAVWAAKDAILAKLDKVLMDEAGDNPGLTDEARASRIAEISRDLLAAARQECALIELAHAQGMTSIEFREDTDPLALLNLELRR